MGYIKKLIAVIFVLSAVFCLYAQTNTEPENVSSTVAEQSIILSDDAVTETSQSEYKGNSTLGTFVRMIVVLIIVVMLIYGVLWFVKKKTNVVKTDDDYLRRVAYINIAPGKTVEVVTLIDKAYLIGVTEDNITLLGEIDNKELIQAMNLNADKKANTKKPVNFAEVLDLFLVKNKNKSPSFSEAEKKVDSLFNVSQKPDKETKE